MRIALLLNLVVLLMEIGSNAFGLLHYGPRILIYYTTLSNLLALGSSLCFLLLSRRREPPRWLAWLRLLTALHLTVTFLVVVTILAPVTGGYRAALLEGIVLYQHTLCPILTVVSFVFFERRLPSLSRRSILWTLLPTLGYGAVFVVLNLLRIVDGPYPFLRVNAQPAWLTVVWFAVILGGALLLALGLDRLAARFRGAARK